MVTKETILLIKYLAIILYGLGYMLAFGMLLGQCLMHGKNTILKVVIDIVVSLFIAVLSWIQIGIFIGNWVNSFIRLKIDLT